MKSKTIIKLTEQDIHNMIKEAISDIMDNDDSVDDEDINDYERYQPFAPELQD